MFVSIGKHHIGGNESFCQVSGAGGIDRKKIHGEGVEVWKWIRI